MVVIPEKKGLRLAEDGNMQLVTLSLSRTFNVRDYVGPKLCRVGGKVQIKIHWIDAAPDLDGEWYASALGWGHTLVAISKDLEALREYCNWRFPSAEITVEERVSS